MKKPVNFVRCYSFEKAKDFGIHTLYMYILNLFFECSRRLKKNLSYIVFSLFPIQWKRHLNKKDSYLSISRNYVPDWSTSSTTEHRNSLPAMNLSMITFELCVKAVFTARSRPSGDLTRLIPTERKSHIQIQSWRFFEIQSAFQISP